MPDLLMPKLGLTMTEGTVLEWTCLPGKRFAAGEVIVVVETEKIASEIQAPAAGVLHEIVASAGDTVPVGAVIGRWRTDDDNGGERNRPAPAAAPPCSAAAAMPAAAAEVQRQPRLPSRRIVATPLAKRIALEARIDLRDASGSGPGGRITAADVRASLPSIAAEPDGTPQPRREPPAAQRATAQRTADEHQRAIARNMASSKRDVPHFYLATEADVTELSGVRASLAARGQRIGLTPFLLRAMALTLQQQPQCNRLWRDDRLLGLDTVDIGIAVNTDKGLFVPVLRAAAALDFRGTAQQTARLIERARQGSLVVNDVGGGACTLSNAGMHDVTYMSSIITPGQSSILGVGSIRQTFRPDAQGRPLLVQELGLVLSCDHRVFDGVRGLAMLNSIKGYLEQPWLLLMN